MKYPLHWPEGWPRTKHPTWSRFKDTTVHRETRALLGEFSRLGAKSVLISTNIELRLDGLPRSGRRPPEDKGVAVYFTLNGRDRVLACDRWSTIEHNIRAIAKHVEALRGIDRWGVGSVDKAFDGYSALPPPAEGIDWQRVLEITLPTTREEIQKAYRTLVMKCHPDHGGSREDFAELQSAREAALRETTS